MTFQAGLLVSEVPFKDEEEKDDKPPALKMKHFNSLSTRQFKKRFNRLCVMISSCRTDNAVHKFDLQNSSRLNMTLESPRVKQLHHTRVKGAKNYSYWKHILNWIVLWAKKTILSSKWTNKEHTHTRIIQFAVDIIAI